MISKSQSRGWNKIEEFHPKKSRYGYVGRSLSNIRLWVKGKGWNRFNDKNVYKEYIDKEWIYKIYH